jgi:ADP-ribose diphosphatase
MVKEKNRRQVFTGKVTRISEVDLDFGNGQTATFELVGFNTVTGVSALPVTKTGVKLIKHYQAGLGYESFSLPTGGLNAGEDPAKRMQLELQEELGDKSGKLTLMFRSHPLPGYIGSEPGYVYLAEDLSPARLEGDEPYNIEIQELSWDEIDSLIRKNEIVDMRTLTAILYYQKFYRDGGITQT